MAFLAVFGKVVSVVLFSLLLTGLLAVALWPALKHLAQRHRERPQYEEEEIQPVRSTVKEATPPAGGRRPCGLRSTSRWTRRRHTGAGRAVHRFFRHKSDRQKTPDQVLQAESSVESLEVVPAPVEEVPVPVEEAPPPRRGEDQDCRRWRLKLPL